MQRILIALIALYHIVVIAQIPTWFGIFIPFQVHLAISLSSALTLIFLGIVRADAIASEQGVTPRHIVPWHDWLMLISATAGAGYVVVAYDRILDYAEFGKLDSLGMLMTTALVIPLFEALRRAANLALPIIILMVVLITVFQQYLPGVLHGQGYPVDRLLYSFYAGDAGIFGTPLAVAAEFIIVFLIFGSLMHAAGASRWFMDIALAVTGTLRGGPAKASVLASAMFGSFSGSPSGNSATTGVFTIPLMKSTGYSAAFAAAVEAVASSGGIILPPVMGAIAFIMAEWIGVTYVDVVLAALIPALLYYLVIFVSVHLQALKDGIQPMAKRDSPSLGVTFRRGWFYLLPIATLVYFLVIKAYPPGMAGVYACLAVIACSFISSDRELRMTPSRLLDGLDEGVRRWVKIAVITAAIGMMIGALELSGVGLKISRFIIDLSGGNLAVTLLLVGIVSLIVGMGLDATPAYITLATLMAPALIQLGVSDVAAHLFVIYWGLASFYTPPTCLAVFVTASIAQSPVWRTGFEAMRVGLAAFLVPVAFVYNDGLLLQGSIVHVALAVATAIIGCALVAAGVRGYALGPLGPAQRAALVLSGLLLIAPGVYVPLAGIIISASILYPQARENTRRAP